MPNQHKISKCMVCEKWMRADKMKGHMKIHKDLLSLPEEEVKEELRTRHATQLERDAKRQRIKEIANAEGIPVPKEIIEISSEFNGGNLREDMVKDNQLYLERIELGKNIDAIIGEGVIHEESLTKERKVAIDLYRKQRPRLDITAVELRPWQEQAMQLFETPTERQVIWITGRQGNEGKSWFQGYIDSFYGFNRVVRMDLRIKHANICNVLKKRSLVSVDIFIFNDARSVCGEEINLYRILEDIKDGQATASKYDNDNIQFKTPNTVIVFSNRYPKTKKLSRDRWQIYNANQDKTKRCYTANNGDEKGWI